MIALPKITPAKAAELAGKSAQFIQIGIYVKKQAQIWLDIADGRSSESYICEKKWKKITRLLKIIIHPDLRCNMYDGLENYSLLFIYALFCTRCREDDTRYYHTGLLEIARKNFKTFTSAVIFIIGLLTEPAFSRFFSVAPDLKLSKELQLAVKKIIKSSPALADDKIFKLLQKEIRCKITDSEYTPLAYFKKTVISQKYGLCLSHFLQLTVKAFYGIVRIDKLP